MNKKAVTGWSKCMLCPVTAFFVSWEMAFYEKTLCENVSKHTFLWDIRRQCRHFFLYFWRTAPLLFEGD